MNKEFTILSADIVSGWLEMLIQVNGQEIKLSASYLSDAIADLIKSTILICRGVNETEVVWRNEPGETNWKLTNTDRKIKVCCTSRSFNVDTNQFEVEELFTIETQTIRFARQVHKIINQIEQKYPEPTYQEVWSKDYQYPKNLVDKLANWIRDESIR